MSDLLTAIYPRSHDVETDDIFSVVRCGALYWAVRSLLINPFDRSTHLLIITALLTLTARSRIIQFSRLHWPV